MTDREWLIAVIAYVIGCIVTEICTGVKQNFGRIVSNEKKKKNKFSL